MCVNPIVSFFLPSFSKNLSFTFFSFTFSPGLSTLCYALPLSGPDSFQQVLKGNCNSFHLKNMYKYITERKGWNSKRGSPCSCRGPRFPSPAPHTYMHLVTHNNPLPQFQGMLTSRPVVHILECKQKIHTHNVELIFKITHLRGFD